MASEECLSECLTILRLMKGDPWEKAHAGFYGATLKTWPDDVARAVVNRCADTMKFRPSRAELLSTLQASDGRPGAEEAWAMVPKSEAETAVWTQEMAYAAGAAQPLIDAGDLIAARMAFKESYTSLVAEARANGTPVEWQVTLGFDPNGREGPIRDAITKGRISQGIAARYLPDARPHAPAVTSRDPKLIAEILPKLKALK